MNRAAGLLGAAVLLGAAAPATAWGGDVTRRALIVGANDGGLDLQALRYAEEDAWRVAEVLQELGGFSPSDVTVLLSPTEARVTQELADAAAELGDAEETLFLFYYSGHADSSGLRLGSELYPYPALKEDIRTVPADVHLGIVDACRSGALTRIKGASVSAPFLADAPLDAEGEAWLAAAAADEDAQESDRIEGSFFTHYLLSGLRGAADTGDGWVSLNEAYAYAYDRTVARTGGTQAGTQHPSYDFQLQGNGDLRLTEVKRATATVRFPSDLEGEILVLRQPEGTPVAEVAKPLGRDMDLALAPGRYLLRRRVEGEIQEVTVSLSKGSTHTVTRWGDAVAEASNLKGARVVAPRVPRELDLDVPVVDEMVGTIREVTGACERGDFAENPCFSGSISAIAPGGGQFVNEQWVKGAMYGTAFFGLAAGGFSMAGVGLGEGGMFAKGPTGSNALMMGAMMFYGLSLSDAVWNARHHEADYENYRPRTGFELSAETTWTRDFNQPYVTGFALDWIPVRNIAVGIDKTGWSTDSAGTEHLWTGVRFMPSVDARRFRLSPFFAAGLHWQLMATGEDVLNPRIATGGQVRWYATPRYFLVGEGRVEWEQGQDRPALSFGGGLGLHFGG
jgi:hypothetical protein